MAEQRALGRTWQELANELGGNAQALRKKLARALDRVTAEIGSSVLPQGFSHNKVTFSATEISPMKWLSKLLGLQSAAIRANRPVLPASISSDRKTVDTSIPGKAEWEIRLTYWQPWTFYWEPREVRKASVIDKSFRAVEATRLHWELEFWRLFPADQNDFDLIWRARHPPSVIVSFLQIPQQCGRFAFRKAHRVAAYWRQQDQPPPIQIADGIREYNRVINDTLELLPRQPVQFEWVCEELIWISGFHGLRARLSRLVP